MPDWYNPQIRAISPQNAQFRSVSYRKCNYSGIVRTCAMPSTISTFVSVSILPPAPLESTHPTCTTIVKLITHIAWYTHALTMRKNRQGVYPLTQYNLAMECTSQLAKKVMGRETTSSWDPDGSTDDEDARESVGWTGWSTGWIDTTVVGGPWSITTTCWRAFLNSFFLLLSRHFLYIACMQGINIAKVLLTLKPHI
jgi:hypothetical protein